MNRIKEYWNKCDKFLLMMLAAGAVLRIIYLWEYSHFINFTVAAGADVREYYERAVEISSGRIFPEKPDIHGVFYPLVIAPVLALTKSAAALRILQILLNMAAFAGLYFLLAKENAAPKVRRAFLAFAMLFPVLIFHNGELISETLAIPLTAIVMYLLYKMRNTPEKELLYAGFAGVFCAFAVLTHASLLLAALFFAVVIFREKRRKCAAVFLALLAAVCGTFIIAKSVHYEKFCFTQANGGFNFYLGNCENADGTCRIRPGLAWRRLHLEAEKEADNKKISTDTLFIGKSLKYMAGNPLRALYGFCRKAVLFFHFRELISGADPAALVYRTKTVNWGGIFTFPIMILAIAGMAAAWKKKEKVPPDFIALFAAVFLVNVLTVTSGRYRIPAYPSLFLFAAYAVAYIPTKVTAALSVICFLPALLFGYEKMPDMEARRILGEAAYRKGDFDTAYRYLSSISDSCDDPSGVQNMLGGIYEQRKEFETARKCYRQVIELEPERFEAYMNLANLTPDKAEAGKLYRKALDNGGTQSGLLYINYAKYLLRTGDPLAAVEAARSGTGLQPDNADAWNTLAVAYAYSGRISLAYEAFEAAAKLVPGNMEYRKNAEIMRQELQKRRSMRSRRRRN